MEKAFGFDFVFYNLGLFGFSPLHIRLLSVFLIFHRCCFQVWPFTIFGMLLEAIFNLRPSCHGELPLFWNPFLFALALGSGIYVSIPLAQQSWNSLVSRRCLMERGISARLFVGSLFSSISSLLCGSPAWRYFKWFLSAICLWQLFIHTQTTLFCSDPKLMSASYSRYERCPYCLRNRDPIFEEDSRSNNWIR